MTTTAGSAEGESMQTAQAYWDSAAETYEDVFSGTTIGKTRREAVWQDLKRLFRRDDHVLEINCGTGLDAVFLAKEGGIGREGMGKFLMPGCQQLTLTR
ncbi:hypothetical protein [Granulicella sp. S190]|uniref:hypothetical protein n=1 Tax=Granulicella sp. S190 TaxID=1747226 RepID=UPI00131C7805|nr:hypothetical protein [Granulicella sp. S190]